MIALLKAGLLGLVEGITEFLPVSSTGHLIVASKLLGVEDSGGTFEIVIQLGAVLAVVWFYRRDLAKRVHRIGDNLGFWRMLLIAVLPAAIVGILLGDIIKDVLFNPVTVGISLVTGGVILWLVERRPVSGPRDGHSSADRALPDTVSTAQALKIGVVQVAALIPGVSRSGATIVGGLLFGLDRRTATTFSFYLAIPTLGGATVYDLVRNFSQISADGRLGELAVGTVVSFATALLATSWLLQFVAGHTFRAFAVYRVLAGSLILVLAGAGQL